MGFAVSMSIESTNAVWKHSRQKSGRLLVLLALADYTNSEGIAWPAVSTLARKVRMSKRNVQRCVRVLEKAGELEVRQNQGRKGSNIYRIRVPTIGPNYPDANDIGDAGVAKAVSPTSLRDDTSVAQSANKPLIESTPVVPKGDETEFWIKLCFDCFEQTFRPLPLHVLRELARTIRFLDRKNADSLRKFYRYEELNSKAPPYNSRRHSPERLMLDLPRQLALAVQTCPPPWLRVHGQQLKVQGKKEPPLWREFFKWKYDDPTLPESFYELDENLRQEYEREFQTFANQRAKEDKVMST
jgi:hypothetical protein